MAKPYKRTGSRFWWIAPWIDNRQVPQSSGETDYDRAERKLKILEGKIAANAPITARTDRDSFAALLELVRTDYKIKRRRSLYDLEKRIDVNLSPILGHLPAGKAWTEISNYILSRQEADPPAANGTINRELAIIKRAYRLGHRIGTVSFVPYIEMLPEENERTSFYSKEQFHSVLGHAAPLVKNILTVAYITGWRIASILKLEWRQVDLNDGFVWLNAKDTKNTKATRWPLDVAIGDICSGWGLREAFEDQRRRTDEIKDSIIPYVFHRDGASVKSIRTAWENLRIKAGVPGHVVHDFRGTAIINLLEAGVDTPTIMNMVGLKTERMVIRYSQKRGMREDRLREAGALLEVRLKAKAKAATT